MILAGQKILLALFILATLACSRKEKAEVSTIRIMAPSKNSKASALATSWPSDRKVCFGVNVSGPGIQDTPASTCSPGMGLFAGFVEEGQVLELMVPQGADRKFDLYLFAQRVGENSPCPQMGAVIPASRLSSIYYMGSSAKVEISKETETVDISANFPGLTENIAKSLSLPATCTASADPNTGNKSSFEISVSAQVSTGAGYKLSAVLGKTAPSNILVGGGYRLKVK